MRILLTGANGQVGWELSSRGGQRDFDILALNRSDLDITDPVSVGREVNRSGVSLVVNATGYTAVDEAESEPELAFAVNRDGPAFLASACEKVGIPLVHISTDYVFDGQRLESICQSTLSSALPGFMESTVTISSRPCCA
jgi:dTDP-4-dehydrorhamnose reductase